MLSSLEHDRWMNRAKEKLHQLGDEARRRKISGNIAIEMNFNEGSPTFIKEKRESTER